MFVMFILLLDVCLGQNFNYRNVLIGPISTLSVQIYAINYSNGNISVTGYDTRNPTIPFTWDWGDGNVNEGWFPQWHTYSNLGQNYTLKVTAHYSATESDSVKLVIRFIPSTINPIPLPVSNAVLIPDSMVNLISRMPGYGIPNSLTFFDSSFFPIFSRSDIEYILTLAATIQIDFANSNVYLPNSEFKQVVLRDSAAGGMYSLWYTTPVSFGAGDYGFRGSLSWSSFFHEMGHNTSLNFPANYYFGGKIDGNANAIFSESMAQIFQHSTGYEIINNYQQYGLDEILKQEIETSAISSMKVVRQFYDDYLTGGMHFYSWNDPQTPNDETIYTFMTVAFKFFEHAENGGSGYKIPLKRMMVFLENFDSSWAQDYSPQFNTAAADTFRSTMMTSAIGYAFNADLRNEFRSLNFPISDEIHNRLLSYIGMGNNEPNPLPRKIQIEYNYPNPFNDATKINFFLPNTEFVKINIYDNLGRFIRQLLAKRLSAGKYEIQWDGRSADEKTVPSGIYFCSLSTENVEKSLKICLLK